MGNSNAETTLCDAELSDLARGIFHIWHGSTHDLGSDPVLKGLKLPQYIVMRALSHGPMRMTGLSELTGTSSANVTGMVDRLVERGLAVREHDSEDRRVVFAKLTPLGQDMLAEQSQRFQSRVAALLDPLDPDECHEFVRLLDKIRTSADAADRD